MRNEISALGIKKIPLLIFLFLFSVIQIHAAEEEKKATWYKLYEKRVKNVCEPYKPDKVFFRSVNYQEIDKWDWFEKAKKLYKENMNNIYKCAIIQSQIDGLERVRNILIKNNIALQKRIEKKLENKKKKLELISNTIGKKRDIIEDDIEKIENDINEIETQEEKNEKNIDKSEEVIEDTLESLDKGWECINQGEDGKIGKKNVLKHATYELCKYHSYLEYLREYNSDISKLVDENWEKKEEAQSYNISYIAQLEVEKKNLIGREIARSYDIFPIAFDAYSQYETNLSLHLLLELIKEDYITLRRKLHDTINPINQVVYKIANAMKK